MATLNMIGVLKPFKTMWKIRVKIIRLWKQYSMAGGETIEMVIFIQIKQTLLDGKYIHSNISHSSHIDSYYLT